MAGDNRGLKRRLKSQRTSGISRVCRSNMGACQTLYIGSGRKPNRTGRGGLSGSKADDFWGCLLRDSLAGGRPRGEEDGTVQAGIWMAGGKPICTVRDRMPVAEANAQSLMDGAALKLREGWRHILISIATKCDSWKYSFLWGWRPHDSPPWMRPTTVGKGASTSLRAWIRYG